MSLFRTDWEIPDMALIGEDTRLMLREMGVPAEDLPEAEAVAAQLAAGMGRLCELFMASGVDRTRARAYAEAAIAQALAEPGESAQCGPQACANPFRHDPCPFDGFAAVDHSQAYRGAEA